MIRRNENIAELKFYCQQLDSEGMPRNVINDPDQAHPQTLSANIYINGTGTLI